MRAQLPSQGMSDKQHAIFTSELHTKCIAVEGGIFENFYIDVLTQLQVWQ
jgi:hypothetical protein